MWVLFKDILALYSVRKGRERTCKGLHIKFIMLAVLSKSITFINPPSFKAFVSVPRPMILPKALKEDELTKVMDFESIGNIMNLICTVMKQDGNER